ncbi:MAG: vWA domain-containing protein [Thermoguttaceae bacterium]
MFRTTILLSLLFSSAVAHGGENVVVVLDDSGSMSDRMRSDTSLTKMEAAKQALATVLQGLPPDAQVGVVLLNGQAGAQHWAYPLGPVDAELIGRRIRQIEPTRMTPLGERMKTAADAILALRAEQHYGSYRLLIVTDGEANDAELVETYLPDILARGIWVDVIGVDMAADHSLATKVHSYRKADDPASLAQALAEVFAESTGSSGDADESDFELIAAIPSEVAAAALQALATSENHPIGEERPVVQFAIGVDEPAGDGPIVAGEPTVSGAQTSGGVRVVTPVAGFACVAVIGLLVVALVIGGFFLVLFTASRRK